MDRRLDPDARWNRDRRVSSGERLAELLEHRDAVTFDEMLAAAQPASVGDVSDWIAHATAGGMLEEIAPDGGSVRRFALHRAAARREWQRRSDDHSI